MSSDKIEVSIVIVCMSDLVNLIPCLNSISNFTTKIRYEIIVVAYLFSAENKRILKEMYPDVRCVESDEIRGFSENNNLALRIAKGKYCFVLNDDTIFHMPVIELLVEAIEQESDAAFMSPVTLFADGHIQSCGRPPMNIVTYTLSAIHLWNEQKIKSNFTNQSGVFQSYNIVGAAFLARMDVMRSLGFFDERFFFCPEDIALSTLANSNGHKCYVNANVSLTHLEGGTAKKIQKATFPAIAKGNLIFFGQKTIAHKMAMWVILFFENLLKCMYWIVRSQKENRDILVGRHWNALKSLFSSYTPKQTFIRYYNILRSGQ